jgi:hypothetical protein
MVSWQRTSRCSRAGNERQVASTSKAMPGRGEARPASRRGQPRLYG